ncbi:MAG: hypothetical protein QXN02_04270 [Ignisphaera sp.]
MVLNDSGIPRYRAYIIYGRDVENILKRIAAFVNGCRNIVAESSLRSIFSRLCEDATYVELKDYSDVDRVILSYEEGKAIVFPVSSPRLDVHAIALIPIDKTNKLRISGGR